LLRFGHLAEAKQETHGLFCVLVVSLRFGLARSPRSIDRAAEDIEEAGHQAILSAPAPNK
jgi:hypothetical protein